MDLAVMALQKEDVPTAADNIEEPARLLTTASSSSTSNSGLSLPSELHESEVSSPWNPEPSAPPLPSSVPCGRKCLVSPLDQTESRYPLKSWTFSRRRDANAVAQHDSEPPITEDNDGTSEIHAEPERGSERVERSERGCSS